MAPSPGSEPGHRLAPQIAWNLCASLLQGGLAIAALPLVTLVLGPAELGAYALVLSVANLAVALCELGGNVVLSGHFAVLDGPERRRLVGSTVALSSLVSIALGALFVVLWPRLAAAGIAAPQITAAGIVLAGLAIPAAGFGVAAKQALVVAGRSHHASAAMALFAAAMFCATLLGLFVFELGLTALFAANLAGQVTAGAALVALLRSDLGLPRYRWIAETLKIAPSGLTGSFLESARGAIENVSLARYVGVGPLGLYAHSKLYGSFLLQGTNAVAFAMWPRALAEARSPDGRFEEVGEVWSAVHLGLAAAGLVFALVGREIIAVITHGRFVEAAVLAPIWIAHLLLQNSGKPALATLYAHGRGRAAIYARSATLLFGIAILLAGVPHFGLWAAVAAAFIETLAYRIWVHYVSRRLRPVPFQDRWVVLGCGLVGAATVLGEALAEHLVWRTLMLLAAMVLTAFVGRDTLRTAQRRVRALVPAPGAIASGTGP